MVLFVLNFLTIKEENYLKMMNCYDFYTLIHAPGNMTFRSWYYPKLTKLDRILRIKWKENEKKVKTLPKLIL